MDEALIVGATVFFGLVAAVLWANYLGSRKGKRGNREIGYRREEFQINPADVPEFKPTWQDMGYKREAR